MKPNKSNFDKKYTLLLIFFIFIGRELFGQDNKGMFSLGIRSTANAFSDDGFGLGVGGQFRIQFAESVNSDWFADYIVINENKLVRSEYIHIGWSLLYYPFSNKEFHQKISPYIAAGHCFDFNKKSEITNIGNSRDRWGSAVQGGLGFHWNVTQKFDLTVMSQYMIHFTEEIAYSTANNSVQFLDHGGGNSLEGHLLTTLSFNYKIGKLWARS